MQRQLSTPAMPRFPGEGEEEEEEYDDLEAKPGNKAPAVRSSSSSVHLIPLLTLLCFVVLFLCSHVPSASDMSSFGGKAASRKPK
ncbi:hypothetical protein BRADI_5g20140v3 [Brachypodium distachyon]|uniref:Uncharacterized protein n=1 Tax=Brachypodium distachyon TaxID=15368 RepID=I1J187_BRADI|nr:hypothetical protein BRADI_5g20140v3 [Brachypodium distachyon]